MNFYIPESIQSSNATENIAQVVSVHKERYTINSGSAYMTAEITGNLRYRAESTVDLPAVGDFVEFMPMDDEHAIIVNIFPRTSMLKRKLVGKKGESQLIGVNIDFCFITMAVNRDFNINRFERYLSICYDANIQPILILSKVDLIAKPDLQSLIAKIRHRHSNIHIIESNVFDVETLQKIMSVLKTNSVYCFVGSSGVGKSTIINALLGDKILRTNQLSNSNNKGKHTTTHRELFYLNNGAMIIDTPGMREIGLTESNQGLDKTFQSISDLKQSCKYADCTHTNEPGCAIIAALENGELSTSEYDNFLKLQREQEHYTETVLDKKRKSKDLARLIKEVKSTKPRYK